MLFRLFATSLISDVFPANQSWCNSICASLVGAIPLTTCASPDKFAVNNQTLCVYVRVCSLLHTSHSLWSLNSHLLSRFSLSLSLSLSLALSLLPLLDRSACLLEALVGLHTCGASVSLVLDVAENAA